MTTTELRYARENGKRDGRNYPVIRSSFLRALCLQEPGLLTKPPQIDPTGMQSISDALASRGHEGSAFVYIVDDEPDLTELYSVLLAGAGHRVRAFNDRAQALKAFEGEPVKPDLLITDYFGLAMHVLDFMRACRLLHPRLRVLMASGFVPPGVRTSLDGPDNFICKPFNPDEFLEQVERSLVI